MIDISRIPEFLPRNQHFLVKSSDFCLKVLQALLLALIRILREFDLLEDLEDLVEYYRVFFIISKTRVIDNIQR